MKKKKINISDKNCLLLLENNEVFYGYGYGKRGISIGEICFNTSITGYQEILTDPSYRDQIITFTFPHIGIVGTNKEDYESEMIHSAGCIINNSLTISSNHRSDKNFETWLKNNNKTCISNIDTRNLTRKIRSIGALKALICFPKKNENFNLKKLKKILKDFPSMHQQDLASEVSTKKIYSWPNKNEIKNEDFKKLSKIKCIAVIDFGVKNNILNLLNDLKYSIIVFPLNSKYEEILKINPDGIFLSNGPGDPEATYQKIKMNFKNIFNSKIPIFGICLGHQILALGHGAKTKKMHHGHRGANHPVKNHEKRNVEITVQNHGFVVEKNKLPNTISITHSSLFDETISGIQIKNKPFFSVQYHPEASPGPHDSRYLFLRFKSLMETYAKKN